MRLQPIGVLFNETLSAAGAAFNNIGPNRMVRLRS